MSRHAGEYICWELREQLNFQAIAPLAARIHADQLGGNPPAYIPMLSWCRILTVKFDL
jgi:hypothetical protein